MKVQEEGLKEPPQSDESNPSSWVPIRLLKPMDRHAIGVHLLALAGRDRYLRFGHYASDDQVQRYVDGLDFDRDLLFGVFDRLATLVAVGHLAFVPGSHLNLCAEFGVSVAQGARGLGYGGRLFERAVMQARNEGVEMLYIHALSENTAMIRIAQGAGAEIARNGAESEACLSLLPATLDSRVSALVDEQLAQTDYQLKLHARQWRVFLQKLRMLRARVWLDSSHKSQ